MKLLYISPYVPDQEVKHAGGAFFADYARIAAAHCSVTVIAPATEDNQVALKRIPEGISVVLTPLRPSRLLGLTGTRAIDHIIHGIAPEPGMRSAIVNNPRCRAAVAEADIVEIHFSQLLPLLPQIREINPRAPMTGFVYEVLSDSPGALSSTTGWRRPLAWQAVRATKRREPRFLRQVDQIFVLSSNDQGRLRDLAISTPIEVVPPTIHVLDQVSRTAVSEKVLFVGAMSRAENAEGVLWFAAEVWPKVVSRLPSAALTIAGADPPPSVTALRSENISVTGRLDSLDEVYREAALSVAPARRTGGVKFKVLEAMARGLPVVATPQAASGIIEDIGRDAFGAVTEDPSTMAQAITDLLVDTTAADAIAEHALSAVRNHYNPERSVERALSIDRKLVNASS
jgi:glycosyltransferase involved in cell wall biosynthesis